MSTTQGSQMKARGILGAAVAMMMGVSVPAFAGAIEDEPFFSKPTLNDLSLNMSIQVDANCSESWKVLTQIEKLQKLAPHLGLTANGGQTSAEKRGDVLNFAMQKPTGIVTGQFVLASPVPNARVQAVVVPDKGPWMRIQQWDLQPQGETRCTVGYNEAYNEIWVRAVGLMGSDFIAKNRNHHIHVILRRIKFMAEGKEPGPAEEQAYLFADGRDFPAKFVVNRTAAK
jgi:hypothetical protein